jgi:hypothetical protein
MTNQVQLLQSHIDNEADPYLLVLDPEGQLLDRFNTMTASQTNYTVNVLNAIRSGAVENYEYLDKADAVSEEQLRAIYPMATPTLSVNPLSRTDMTIIHDNVRREGNTKRALMYFTQGMLGKEPTITLDVARRFATEDRRTAELDAILANETYLGMLEELMYVDDICHLYDRMQELIYAGHAFGRSACLKQYDLRGIPCNLIPLSSLRLGRVYVDRKTKQFLGVEYLDYSSSKNILMAKDIIYYVVDDYQISPNSRYYGMPAVESSMYIAQSNRVANEISKPEIIAKMWAPLMIIKSKSRSREKLTEIRNSFQAGKITFINNDLDIDVIPLQHDLEKLNNVVNDQSKQIYRDLTVPLGVGFQDEQNRATLEGTLQQWYDGPLQFKRSHLNKVIWDQWYKPILEDMLEGQRIDQIAIQGGLVNYMMDRARGNIPKLEIPFKVRIVFNNIRVAGFLDMSQALLSYRQAGLINDDITRSESNMGQYNEIMHEEQAAKALLRNNAMLSQEMAIQLGPSPKNPNESPASPNIKETELATKANGQSIFAM